MIERSEGGFVSLSMKLCANEKLISVCNHKLGLLMILIAAATVPATAWAEVADVRRDATVEAVERVMPSVVNIATETIIQIRDPFEEMLRQFFDPYHRQQAPNSQLSLGSGVIIDEEGYVLTNDHVVRRADKIWVKIYGHETPYEAKLISSNPKTDVALLKLVAKPGEQFAAVKFARDDDLLLGETVLALGNPFGLGGSVSRGILSSKSRSAPKDNDALDVPNWLQTDASINPGNSGGPLVNLHGELIGLNVAILSKAQGIGFAIPIKLVSASLSEIITPEMSGKSLWFGALVKVGAPPLAITSVQPQSPAAKAGLKTGDHILKVNGKSPKGFIDFNELLLNSEKSDIALTIQGEGEAREVTVKLIPEKTFFNADLIHQMLGVRLEENTPQLANRLRLASANGFVIADVDENAPATRDLKPGYLVTGIDGQTPHDLTGAAKIVFGKKKGDIVQLDLIVQQRRGNFIYPISASVKLPIR